MLKKPPTNFREGLTINFFKIYILPGFIFQSVVIGGGYATGRELIEFFFAAGPIGGLLGLLVSGTIFGLVLALSFELARICKTYDYRSFCKALLGRGWFLFEIIYFIQLLLVLAVIGAAAGELTGATFGLPPIMGTLALMALIGILTFNGSQVIKRVLAGWSLLLYAVYILLFVLAYKALGGDISETYNQASLGEGWVSSGILYSGYNLAVVPAILFAITEHKRRRETIGAGLIAGAIAVIPAMLFFVAMMGKYAEIGTQPVPASFLMSALDIRWLELVFQVVIFGTFVETGAAMLHAVNQRIATSFVEREKNMPRIARPIVSVTFLAIAIYAGHAFGIVSLIAGGYGILTLAFIAVLVLPLLTIGLWKIVNNKAVQ